jgi:hypothetical protein
MKFKSGLGVSLLAVYLIIVGIMGAFGVSLGGLHLLVPILAIIAGVALLTGK